MAALTICLLCLNSAVGQVVGVEGIEATLPWYDAEKNYEGWDRAVRDKRPNAEPAVTSLGRPPLEDQISLLLSRFEYPAEDGHLDVIVRLDVPEGSAPEGELRVSLADAAGDVLSEDTILSIPAWQVFFSYELPTDLTDRSASLRVDWVRNDELLAQAEATFQVAAEKQIPSAGRIQITVPNDTRATVSNAPMTTGVPFPRGVLRDTSRLRLVDEHGREIPLQVKETARWSRYGSVRWVLCDFVLDLEGESRELYIEYGPEVSRTESAPLAIEVADHGFPRVDAGRLRFDERGISVTRADGGSTLVIDRAGLTGGFVEHVRGVNFVDWSHEFTSSTGQIFTMPGDAAFALEEHGSNKVVLRTDGWYRDETTGDRFCQYVVRYVIHADSPIVRIFHTWIFTGDGNEDRIRNMGWRFPLNEAQPSAFLSSFGDEARWLDGYYLRQHAHDAYALFEYDEPRRTRRVDDAMMPAKPIREVATGKRAPGVMLAEGDGVQVYVGIKDFWQNFPSSLALEDGALVFYQWPKYGEARRSTFTASDLGDIWRLAFAHEGEVLSFSLPMELTQGPIYVAESGPEPHIAYGNPNSVNAQGIAKTAEMWLYLTTDDTPSSEAAVVLEGLNAETLRAVVDPVWMAASGAFYEIHPRDEDNYPEAERLYALNVDKPIAQVEHMGLYGKWIHGDLLRSANLEDQTAPLYRTFRKAHWGWPYSWIPYVRSGDARYLKFAEAATRMMSDVAFCHYVSDDVRAYFEGLPKRQLWHAKQPFREIGWHNRNLIPWAGYWGPTTRLYVDEVDYLWHAYYVTGYHRARDVARTWAEHTKIEHPDKFGRGPITAAANRDRWPVSLQKQYIETYEATFDPWFLAAAHAIADMHVDRLVLDHWWGSLWNTGPADFYRFTKSPKYETWLRAFVEHHGHWQEPGWVSTPSTLIPASVWGYYLTGDVHYLRRAAGILDVTRWATFDGNDPPYYLGYYVRSDSGGDSSDMLFTSWYQKWFPMLLAAFEQAETRPEPLPLAFTQTLSDGVTIAVRKSSKQAIPLAVQGAYRVTDASGQAVMEGQSSTGEPVIAADDPDGTYYVQLDAHSVMMPITPPGIPEVLVLPVGQEQSVGAGEDFAQYWFYVPDDLQQFTITFDNTRPVRQMVRQVAIWNPEGERVWTHRQVTASYDADEAVQAVVDVPREHAGRLWRVTLPGRQSMSFVLDAQLPNILAHSPDRWFVPEESLLER